MKPAYSISTVAEALAVARSTIHALIKTGGLKAFRVSPSGPWRVPRAEVVRMYGREVADYCEREEGA